jgi:putative redox protein
MSSLAEPVVVRSLAGLAQSVSVEGHELVADEPAALGGTATGPTPYGLMLSALGTCTSITVRMYAARKGWPLTGVTVRLRDERVHARDMEDSENATGFVHVIHKEVVLEGELDEDQLTRLHQIAGRCPVHKLLTHEVKIRSTVGSP